MQRQTCAGPYRGALPTYDDAVGGRLQLPDGAVRDDGRAAVRHDLRDQPVGLSGHIVRLVHGAVEAVVGRVVIEELDGVAISLQRFGLFDELPLLLFAHREDHAAVLLVPDAVVVEELLDDGAVAQPKIADLPRRGGAQLLDLLVIGRLEQGGDESGVASRGAQRHVPRIEHDDRLTSPRQEGRQRAADDPSARRCRRRLPRICVAARPRSTYPARSKPCSSLRHPHRQSPLLSARITRLALKDATCQSRIKRDR